MKKSLRYPAFFPPVGCSQWFVSSVNVSYTFSPFNQASVLLCTQNSFLFKRILDEAY
jgi:hypothetical protein